MSPIPAITLEWVRKEKARHKQALADLEAAERLLAAAGADSVEPSPSARPESEFVVRHGGKRRALLVLIAESPDGLSTAEAIREATNRGIMDLSTASVSPKLSESRKTGLLELENGRWRITDKGRAYIAPKSD